MKKEKDATQKSNNQDSLLNPEKKSQSVGIKTTTKSYRKEPSLMQQYKNGPDIIELDLSDEEYNFNQPKKKKKLPFDNKPFNVIKLIL
jgi:hypothetical protein